MGVLYNAPNTFQKNDFSLGMDVVSSPTALEPNAMRYIRNGNLTPSRGIEKRGGITKLIDIPVDAENSAVKDIFEWDIPTFGRRILAISNNKLKYLSTTSWELISPINSDYRTQFIPHRSFCFLFNRGLSEPKKLAFKDGTITMWPAGIKAPSNAPQVSEGGEGTLTGKYVYVYCYKRGESSYYPSFIGNPSPASQEITVTNKKIAISVTESSDPQVTSIVIYRTFNLNLSQTNPEQYFKVAEITNHTQVYYDETPDSDLGELVEFDNTFPPKALFGCVYRDYMIYANCPDEESGESLIMYSKRGNPEAVPSTNYEYFDRDDGEAITGVAPLPDYLLVFKRDKIMVVQGDFESKTSVATFHGIGNIAPWAILPFQDKVIFLSEEGWMATDGTDLYRLSEKIATAYITAGYMSPDVGQRCSAIFYPTKNHFLYLIDHPFQEPLMFVGHFLVPLLFIDKGIPEQKSQNIVSWTIHAYDYHRFACLSSYLNELGVIKPLAGGYDGYVYVLDSGSSDDGNPIRFEFTSGWFTLTRQSNIFSIIRTIRINYSTDVADTFKFVLYQDFLPKAFEQTLNGINACYCGSSYTNSNDNEQNLFYCGIEGGIIDRIIANGRGHWFQFQIIGETKNNLTVQSISFAFRAHGTR